MPSIPGLDEWARRFPSLISHSRQYRRPEAYANQTVLVVGASVRNLLGLFLPPADKRSRLAGLKYLETSIITLERYTNLFG